MSTFPTDSEAAHNVKDVWVNMRNLGLDYKGGSSGIQGKRERRAETAVGRRLSNGSRRRTFVFQRRRLVFASSPFAA